MRAGQEGRAGADLPGWLSEEWVAEAGRLTATLLASQAAGASPAPRTPPATTGATTTGATTTGATTTGATTTGATTTGATTTGATTTGATTINVVVAGLPAGDVRYHHVVAGGQLVGWGMAAAPDADVSFTAGAGDAAAMASGELDPAVAFMQGRLKTAGAPGLVLRLLAAWSGAPARPVVAPNNPHPQTPSVTNKTAPC
ncbi:MAG: SCP2 sterol-binding domain-containing protein [Acidimicrobiales bacterium]